MNENKYTSLKLSKLLAERGFKGETNLVYINDEIRHKRQDNLYNPIPAYDLLWDICIKYGEELFGKEMTCYICGKTNCEDCFIVKNPNLIWNTIIILNFLQQNKRQEAEDYIIKNLIKK